MAKTVAYVLFFISALIAVGCIPMLINVIRAHRRVNAALRALMIDKKRQAFEEQMQALPMQDANRESLEDVKEGLKRTTDELLTVKIIANSLGKSHYLTDMSHLADILAHSSSMSTSMQTHDPEKSYKSSRQKMERLIGISTWHRMFQTEEKDFPVIDQENVSVIQFAIPEIAKPHGMSGGLSDDEEIDKLSREVYWSASRVRTG